MGSRSATYVQTETQTQSIGDYSEVTAQDSSVNKFNNVNLEGNSDLFVTQTDHGSIKKVFEFTENFTKNSLDLIRNTNEDTLSTVYKSGEQTRSIIENAIEMSGEASRDSAESISRELMGMLKWIAFAGLGGFVVMKVAGK